MAMVSGIFKLLNFFKKFSQSLQISAILPFLQFFVSFVEEFSLFTFFIAFPWQTILYKILQKNDINQMGKFVENLTS